uniref:COXTT12,Transmembrane protein,Transmembrane protein n=1 Tax=Tetrahymena thermophila (strain SB210) TaxID=312017 RepID=UPI0023F59737|nr:Chain EA, COXTT12,Transmembrane protein,Transmembrane protein [Tetrahymena thermophila SB210]8B6H_Ea Chain Ea, COXTT12,Transmembrane protein,Transmembrane protein [Tetrahymena thermophila SB210]8BQS_EA Chain EA, COXTT12,Transmembrane protein,Transmembrane protein [Tetrahymena thermophila SB210]8BQS_Ea Chain Ea, COXTT12,Transmembrane protein,Transmembrane protein [Tetrahymena thermophila SB210]
MYVLFVCLIDSMNVEEGKQIKEMILPHNNRQLARQYFDSLPENDINRKYYEGLKYETPKTFFGRFLNQFNIDAKLDTLSKFYTYQKTIRATQAELQEDRKSYLTNSLLFTAVSWFSIYQFARKGAVLPVLREYGRYFGTHRLFRQYLHTLVLPLLYTEYALNQKYYTHMEHLWTVHVNRLNQKILEDPLYTFYPQELNVPKHNIIVPTIFRDTPQ